MKIVAIGDAHLWPVIRPKLPHMQGDAFAAYKDALEVAKSAGADQVIQVGDMFDYGEKGGVSCCLDFLAKLDYPEVHVIEGNHDLPGYSGLNKNPPWVSALAGKMTRLSSEPAKGFGELSVVGIDYCRGREEFLDRLQEMKKIHPDGVDILVLHQGHVKLLGFEGCWEVQDEDISGWANLVLIGHVHTSVSWKDDAGTTWVSPGSIYRWRANEAAHKRVAVIEFTDDGVKVDWVQLEQQREMWYEVAETDEERQSLLQRMRDHVPNTRLVPELQAPYLSLQYLPEVEFVRELTELSRDRFFVESTPIRVGTVRVSTGTEEQVDVESETLEQQVARVTAKHVNRELDPELFDLAVQIQLDVATDPSALIDEAVERILRTEEVSAQG
jgi:DNA repair exonuclease SbcCD nuclease subunit